MSTPHRARRAGTPFGRAVAAATAAVLALTGAVALGAGPLAAPASAAPKAQLPQCPAPGEMPGIGNLPAFTDSNIAVYAGGDYSATGTAAESEGLLVVMGDATFDKAAGGIYNVGSAGVGSQITPPGGTTMLAVGGDLTVGPRTTMDVGANVVGGGNVDVGGSITNTVPLALNGGVATPNMGAAAVASHAGFQDVITEESRLLAQPVGTPGTIESWGELRFSGDPAASMHTFTVDGAALSSLGKKMSVFFDDVGSTAPIVVNVTGSTVDFDAQSFFFGTTQVNSLSSPEIGNAASRILWNFVDATSVELGENDQFLGSVLAPHADTTLKTSTNGRVYVGKTLSVLGTGGGIEQHNYPWIGPGPFACISAEPGGFTVAKSVVGDGADLVSAGTEFTVAYSYTANGTPVAGTLTVKADGTVVDGPADLPAGTVVTLSEPDLPVVPGVEWGTPSFAPSDTVTIGASGTAAVRLTNTASAQLGGFSVAKAVTGLAASQVPASTEFTVAYTVTVDGTSTQGTVKVRADGTVVDGPQDLPVGAVVTFAEIDLPTVPGVVWGAPSFDPASITVADGESPRVTLTNTADAAVIPVGGFSVQKVVENAPAGMVPADTAFTVAYSYELDGVPTSGTLTVRADGTAVDGPQNLPAGTVVTFGEVSLPDVDGVVWGAPVFSPASLVVGANENAKVTLTNTAEEARAGGFSMAKSVTGEAADKVPAGTEFTVRYAYDLDGVPTTGTMTVKANGTVVDGPQNLREGTVVTFEEIALPAVDDVVWGTPVFSPESLVVGANEKAEVTLTNTALDAPAGGFSLAKAVTGLAADKVPRATEFTVRYTYDLGGVTTTGTLAVTADGTVVDGPQNLPVGTVVTFTELAPPSLDGVVWGAPVFSPASVTIADGENTLVTVTNTANAVVVPLGGFSMAKELTGEAAGRVPADTEFTATYEYTIDGATLGGTLTLLADGTVVDGPQNLVAGTVVTFTELTPAHVVGVEWGTPVFSPARVTIGSVENTAVTLTNTANAEPAGGFSLTKVVEGSGASVVPAGTEFTVRYAYELDGAPVSGTSTVAADGTVVDGPQNLPVGTVVTFTETDLPAVAGVVWGTPVFSPAQVTVTDGQNAAVTLTNTADVVAAQVGGFTIAKKVTGPSAAKVPADTQFTVAISGTVNGEHTEGTLTVRADGTVVEGPANLPAGTVVDLAEVDLPKVEGVRWGTPVFTVDGEKVTSVTIGAGQTVAVALTNTADAADGGLAATGARVAGIAAVALLLVGGGGALLVGARRRRA
ncbi:DUF5979 domain-containing protein [Oerskovia paurometabola]|uniref:DUF5979 domain-containing protein n=1 Tax=Oerskovia paurometabola TaxID=162170 RepID=UPI003808F120